MTLDISPRLKKPKHHYPGLRPFEPDERMIFFGRDTMVDDVIDRLARDRLVFVHGASGSGKSSLIRAGVLPRSRASSDARAAPGAAASCVPLAAHY